MKRIKLFNEAKSNKMEKKVAKKAQIAEIKSRIKSFEKEFDVIEIVSFDWKEISEDVIELMERTIEALGGYLQHDPTYDGSDTYGFIISKKPISKAKLKEYADITEELNDAEV